MISRSSVHHSSLGRETIMPKVVLWHWPVITTIWTSDPLSTKQELHSTVRRWSMVRRSPAYTNGFQAFHDSRWLRHMQSTLPCSPQWWSLHPTADSWTPGSHSTCHCARYCQCPTRVPRTPSSVAVGTFQWPGSASNRRGLLPEARRYKCQEINSLGTTFSQ